MILGFIVAIPSLAKNKYLTYINIGYVEIVRAIPLLVLILWIYYGLPIMTGISFSPFVSGIIALSISESAFQAEIFRAGINSIKNSQWEAGSSLGLNFFKKLRLVILPQAIKNILPAIGNQFVYVLKMSSLVSIIGIGDLTRKANELVVTTYRPLEIYTFLIFEYLILVAHGSDTRGFSTPFSNLDWRISGFIISIPQLVSLLLSIVIVAGLSMLLKKTKVGRALRAIAENPDAATLMGIEVNRIVPIVFILTGFLCGISAAIFAINYHEVSPYMGDHVGTKAIAAMVIGGLGSVWGAIAGGLIVGLSETLSIYFFGASSAQITVWGLLLILLIFKPTGLFGHNAIGKGKF